MTNKIMTIASAPLIETERVSLDEHGREAAILWFNRPDALNAISWEAMRDLAASLAAAEQDHAVRAVFIAGRGRAFSAGGDIKAYKKLQADGAAFTAFVDDYCRLTEGIADMTKPVIALVNGLCAAGGLELLLACDFAWAAESARIGDMHVNFAQIGGSGAMARLPRLIGQARALELVLSGEMLDSRLALEWGIVNRVVPDDRLLEEGLRFARALAAKSPNAVKFVKQSIRHGMDQDLPGALKFERDQCLRYCLTLPDSMEGINAFIEKRDPVYGAGQ
ncbi:MAG: enoyl-CoA hydratase/isomerase family protein [Sphingobium sp.]|uniref:enoyl-CoA hydratase/isomerase family protein n=1 Tax=Sphingobium sp. TaxID=1912891 RepID=UPI0029B4DD84|nr:enoyl-CoA hydratase/isomerase family protein [Sphingobium sp.]MDX3909577.1 enoyl-CoA hydratase/isomerase family protein [Sphingobium sp.]